MFSSNNPLRSPRNISLSVLTIAIVVGTFLTLKMGDALLYSPLYQLNWLAPWLIGLFVPTFFFLLICSEAFVNRIKRKYPTPWVQWFFLIPSLSIATAVAIVYFLVGWLALWIHIFGTEDNSLTARIIQIEAFKFKVKSCSQHATIEIEGKINSLCVENKLLGPTPAVGDVVKIRTRTSPLGTYIEEINSK